MAFAYYNEIDPVAVEWLRWLIAEGHIADGWVDERSIADVEPRDLEGFTQHHFFAGIGGWSYAARLAGWPDDKPLWSASCPCQPFSVAGKGAGVDDERHLWPHVIRLVRAARPAVLVGEQVAGKAGYGWFDGVSADLARENYASRYVDIPACAVDAPHIRSRGYWIARPVGDGNDLRRLQSEGGFRDERKRPANADALSLHADGESSERRAGNSQGEYGRDDRLQLADRNGNGLHADANGSGRDWRAEGEERSPVERAASERNYGGILLPDADGQRLEEQRRSFAIRAEQLRPERPNGSFWSDYEWLNCHDGKARRAKSGIPLLVDGLPGRVAAWRGFGNAIVAPIAAEVLAAYLDTEQF